MGVEILKMDWIGVHWKIPFLGGIKKKPISRGDCLKRWLGQSADLRKGLAKKGVMFWGGDTLMHTTNKKIVA